MAVGNERTHAARFCERQCLTVEACSILGSARQNYLNERTESLQRRTVKE
jgi:hypothetical protein